MDTYNTPPFDDVCAQLERAGADPDMISILATGIFHMANGVRRKKGMDPSVSKLLDQLRKANVTWESMPEPERTDFSCDVGDPLGKAIGALELALQLRPGGHREQAHAGLAVGLARLFVGRGLPVDITNDSPFVALFSMFTGLAPFASRRALERLNVLDRMAALMDATGDAAARADSAYSDYVKSLTDGTYHTPPENTD